MKNKKTLLLAYLYAQISLSKVHDIYRHNLLITASGKNDYPFHQLQKCSPSFMCLFGGEQHVLHTINKHDFEAAKKRLFRHLHEFNQLLNMLRPMVQLPDVSELQGIEVDILRLRSFNFDVNLFQTRVNQALGTFSDFTLISQ